MTPSPIARWFAIIRCRRMGSATARTSSVVGAVRPSSRLVTNSGTTFSGDDFYALVSRSSEIEDGRTDAGATSTNLKKFLNNESLVGQDIVVWYGAHFRHAVLEADGGQGDVGPTLVPGNWPTS